MAECVTSSEDACADMSQASDSISDLCCDPCNEESLCLEAKGFCVECQDYLCWSCIKSHRKKNRASKNHTIVDDKHMPQQRPLKSVSSAVGKTAFTEDCQDHPGELVKFFCIDHQIIACAICMAKSHRMCDEVEPIGELVEGFTDSNEYKRLARNLQQLRDKSRDVIKRSKSNVTVTEQCFKEITKSMETIQSDILNAFDKMEKDISKRAEDVISEDTKNINRIIDVTNEILAEIECILADMNSLKEANKFCQLFILMKKVQGKLPLWRSIIDQVDSENSVRTFKFEATRAIQEIISGQIPLGLISPEPIDSRTPEHVVKDSIETGTHSFESNTAAADSYIDVAIPATSTQGSAAGVLSVASGDSKMLKATHMYDITFTYPHPVLSRAVLSGSARLPGEKQLILLTSIVDKRVYLVTHNPQYREIKSSLILPSAPWDITVISDKLAAITLPEDKTILFVSITDRLSIDEQIQASGKCRGVDFKNGKLFVTFTDPAKVEILSLFGAVERTIEKGSNGADLFKSPHFLAVDPDSETLFVSDRANNSVTAMDLEGTVKARCKNLVMPEALALDRFGRILVADGDLFGKVSLLTQDCKIVKVLKNGLMCCRESSRLYVSSRGAIRVYQLLY